MRAPRTVVFGAGVARTLPDLAARQGTRLLVCVDPFLESDHRVAEILAALRARASAVALYSGVVPELPLASVLDAVASAQRARPDCIVAIGGGSSLDLAKLVALGLEHGTDFRAFYGERRVPGPVTPVIGVPTTAGTGSEVTPVAVLTDPDQELKVGISSEHLIPVTAVCDPELTLGCPAAVTAYAGIDALAHAIEAYTARDRSGDPGASTDRVFIGKNALSDMFALAAVEAIAVNLVAATHDDPHARSRVAYGSLCAGLAFGVAGTAAAHALQYPIGARTSTPHGLGTGLLLAPAMAFNRAPRTPELAQIARASGWAQAETGDDDAASAAVTGAASLARQVGLPRSLAEIGVNEDDLPAIAELALGITRLVDNNPRTLDMAGALELLSDAYTGR
jgi:alcohol dehydrogenase